MTRVAGSGMDRRNPLPFQGLTTDNWPDLALAGVLDFYLLCLVWEMILGTTCGQIAVDFCDYWSAGKVAKITIA